MATRQLNIYADIDSGRLITSAASTLQATLPRFTYRDTIPVSFRALTASGSQSTPWRDADLTGQSVRIAIGNPSARPLSGSFAMTFGADTTTAIQWDAAAADVSSALNILDSVISAGGVSVSKQTNGIYRIAFSTVGVKGEFLTDSGPLVPSGNMVTNRVVTGDATTKEIVALSFEALPAAYADLSDLLPAASATITTVRVGSGSVGEIRTVEFPIIPFGGTYSLAVNGNATTALEWDATAEDVAFAIQYLSGMAGNVSVSGAMPFFTVNFTSTVGAISSMAADTSGLVVPTGRMGTLSTATSEFLDMLAGSSLASAKFEIELHDDATDEAWTIIQADCQVARDIISESPVIPALRPTPADWLATRIVTPITASVDIDPSVTTLTIGAPHWGKRLFIDAPLAITFPTEETAASGRRVLIDCGTDSAVTLTDANGGYDSGLEADTSYIAECLDGVWDIRRIKDDALALRSGDIDIADVAGLEAALESSVLTASLSTIGGANKVVQLDANGTFRLGPVNNTDSEPAYSMTIPAWQRLYFEDKDGLKKANIYLFATHSGSIPGTWAELIHNSPRHCFYWDEGFQFGNATNGREYGRHLYFRSLGNADAGDPVRQSLAVFFNGNKYNGPGDVTASNMALQWVPGTGMTGEFVFAITNAFGAGATFNALTNGSVKDIPGSVFPLSLTENGPKIPAGKVLTFPDGSTMDTAAVGGVPRTGNVTLIAGTADVPDASVTTFTNAIISRRTAAGTIGDLTYTTTDGVGLTINSSSSTDTSRVTYQLIEGIVAADAPTITGTNEITDVLTVASGGTGGGYQWYSNGAAVSGETSTTYTIRPEDAGLPITCREGGIASNVITAWKPADEAGYYANYSADVGTKQTAGGTVSAGGDPVGEWVDQVGTLGNLTNLDVSHRPTKNTALYAGYPFLDFNGTSNILRATKTLTRPMTVFIVQETKAFQANAIFAATQSYGSRLTARQTDTPGIVANGAASSAGSSDTVDVRKIVTARTNATTNAIRVNAATEVVATETTGDGDGFYLGGSYAGSTPANTASIRLFCALYYASDLGDAAQARVRKFLKAKWNTV